MEKKTVLIVEDDPEISDLLEIHLSDLDFSVTKSMDGRKGLGFANSHNRFAYSSK